MPYVQIRYRSPYPANEARLGARATHLMAEVMRKRREVTVVEVVQTHSQWQVAGEVTPGPVAYVDIKITQGTNSAADKAALLAEFQALLVQEIGTMAAPAYVVIHEIPPTDWGFEGLPQATRLANKL